MEFLRHENKYLCTNEMIAIERGRISHITKIDSFADTNGRYSVSSLYFDSSTNISAALNDAGADKRKKYRIRYYDNLDVIKLEKKEKQNGLCNKTSVIISLNTAKKLASGDVASLLNTTDVPLVKELCVKILTYGFKPKVIVTYEREAYLHQTGNVRVTFDTNICCSHQTDRFFDGDYLKIPVLSPNTHLLEVKYDNILPSFIRQTLALRNLNQTTFSKYYLSRAAAKKLL